MFNWLKTSKKDWVRKLGWDDLRDGEFRTNAEIEESLKAVDMPAHKVSLHEGYRSYFVYSLVLRHRKDGYLMPEYHLMCAYPTLMEAHAAIITKSLAPKKTTWYFDKDGNEVSN